MPNTQPSPVPAAPRFPQDFEYVTEPGSRVTVVLDDGHQVHGELIAFLPADRQVRLRAGGEAQTIAFDRINILRFDTDVSDSLRPGASYKSTKVWVKFRNGIVRNCHYREIFKDAAGLHVLKVSKDTRTYRLFIPHENLARFRALDRPVATLARAVGANPDEPKAAPKPHAQRPITDAATLGEVLSSRFQDANPADADEPSLPAANDEGDPFALARRFDVPLVDLRRFEIEARILAELPETFVVEHRVVPLMLHEEHLVVAMENPADTDLIRMAQFLSGRRVEICIASQSDLIAAVHRYYGGSDESDALQELESAANAPESRQDTYEELEKLGREKPIVRLVQSILTDGIRRRASDIHIRPGENDVELLYRQDGTLVSARRFNKALLPAVVARIKIIGRMNVAERRLPQDGRTRIDDHGTPVDFRISVIPTVVGESVVFRLLNGNKTIGSVHDLGFDEEDLPRFVDLLHRSYGVVLVTGPTGSGKSMTLYASLKEILKQNVNVITVEDPVEYRMPGIEQIQVNSVPGFTFARALRNILRHDPDVIMIGEIRDQETARIAVESALTGHLVLSTLHTNDAPTAITRLIEMGVEPFLVRSAVLGALAQRLVRLNCPHCLEVEPVDEVQRRFLGVASDEVFYHGRGCDECNNTGFKGRRAVFELLVMTPRLRDLITPHTPSDEIRNAALESGMRPLTRNALELARQHKISLAEVYRVRLE